MGWACFACTRKVLPFQTLNRTQPAAGNGCRAASAQAHQPPALVAGHWHLEEHPRLSLCQARSCRQWVGRVATLAGDRAAEVRRAATAALEVVYRAMDGPTLLAHIAAASPTEQASPSIAKICWALRMSSHLQMTLRWSLQPEGPQLASIFWCLDSWLVDTALGSASPHTPSFWVRVHLPCRFC